MRVPGPSVLITLAVSLAYFRILLTPGFVFGKFIITGEGGGGGELGVIQIDYIIANDSLVQEATYEYHDLVDPNWW